MTTPLNLQRGGAYELFISYSRKDDVPQKPGDANGWVTALRDEILADHRRFSTEPLRIFFDTSEIRSLDDWRDRIRTGLRQSKILLVCLSPNYFSSPPCLWEWEEYLKRQVHALMGQDSVAPVYFVEVPDSDEQLNAAWAEAVTRKAVTAADRRQWEARWKDWRVATLDRQQWVDLKPFFPDGLAALQNDEVRRRMEALGASLWERIQRARRATGVPGNLRQLNPHFIGRRAELRQLHDNLALGAVGVVTAVHGLGGQGKTELATAYGHGWADCYPAGLWVLGAEGKKEMLPLLGELCGDLELPLSAGAEETAAQRGRRVLAELKRRALEAAPRDPDKGAACLVLLDNVSEPDLLAEPQLALLPREDWLRVVVTTRLGQDMLPASRQKSLAFIAVDALFEDDAARLIEDHQPDGKWHAATAAADAAAAREIARELGGFTLAVESVAIYLGLHPDIRPADYLARLRAEGLPSVDELPADAGVARQMEHREKQLRLVLDQTLAHLAPPERTLLDYAALLPPDSIPWPWLRELVAQEHSDALVTRPGYPDPWPALRRRLEGLRLLTPGDHPEIARLHRMVAAHVRERMGDECHAAKLSLQKDCIEEFAGLFEAAWEHNIATLWILPSFRALVPVWQLHGEDGYLSRLAGLVGQIEMTMGRLGDAETYLKLSEVSAKVVAAHNPQSAQAARDVSLSLNKLGVFYLQRGQPGDAAEALRCFQKHHDMSQKLWADNPQSAQAARDVSLSFARLGDFYCRRGQPGDAAEALRCFQKYHDMSRKLCADNPQSVQAARDVLVSLGLLGDFYRRRGQPGDEAEAVRCFQQYHDMSRKLWADNPQSAQAARDVSVSLRELGDSYQRGQPRDAEALRCFQQSFEVAQKLWADNPQSAQAARDVSLSLNKLGVFYLQRGQPGDAAEALRCFQQGHVVLEKLSGNNAQSARAVRDIVVSHYNLAQFGMQSGDEELAGQHLAECHGILHRLISSGVTFDPPIMSLYEQLHGMFGSSP
jgi:tetratricopeptide (TPR) repeat protein